MKDMYVSREAATNNRGECACKPLSDAEILAQVVYASPAMWGYTREEALLGYLAVMLCKDAPQQMYLLAWPDGVRAMLPSPYPIGSHRMNEAVVNTYRAAATGYIGPVVVGESS